MKKIILLSTILLSESALSINLSTIEKLKDSPHSLSASDETPNSLTPELVTDENRTAAPSITYSYTHKTDEKYVIEINAKLNSSISTDDKEGVIDQFSVGGGDSQFNFKFAGKEEFKSLKGTSLYSIGSTISIMNYSYTISDTAIEKSESNIISVNADYIFETENKLYFGIQTSYYTVISDQDINTVEDEIDKGNTIKLRALIPVGSNDDGIWFKFDFIKPIGNGDPILSISATTNYSLF